MVTLPEIPASFDRKSAVPSYGCIPISSDPLPMNPMGEHHLNEAPASLGSKRRETGARPLCGRTGCGAFQEFLFGSPGPPTPVQLPAYLGKVAIQFR